MFVFIQLSKHRQFYYNIILLLLNFQDLAQNSKSFAQDLITCYTVRFDFDPISRDTPLIDDAFGKLRPASLSNDAKVNALIEAAKRK